MIYVAGEKYVVVENLGYDHERGMYAKVVKTVSGERVAVKNGKAWEWSKPIIDTRFSNYLHDNLKLKNDELIED